ncbi:adenylate/guanylate cyclase domain-containing protein [Spirulina sp. 06S082]|uniref:adenylate/guanylate cyclase domain-containing protein n=1 Tax=Spirulina sp. 06S082 TaxID=3110248 RepID=UPI002B2163E7|nr:adenylate/guanylate cyclase domain-containing protein [Spirulina sp. 06S082]MEA5470400.1 adenylate/guanylate cyclase domain-containing protein [Spirulina sp. 06S082]
MTTPEIEPAQENILVVDDTPANLRLLVTMLKKQGYEVRPTLNGKIALSAARAIPPDLVLLDIMMPEMDGYEVCRRLKADDRTKDVPVIFLSALDDAQDKVKAFEVGGVDYITKPFQKAEVLARITNQLYLRSLQKQLAQQNQRLQDFGDRLKQVHRLNTTAYPNSTQLFADYLETGCQIFGFPLATIARIQGDRCYIEASWGEWEELAITSDKETEEEEKGRRIMPSSFDLAETYCQLPFKERSTIAVDRAGSKDELRDRLFYQQFKLESYVGTPIWVNQKIYGILNFYSPTIRENVFEAREIEIIELMVQSLGKFIAARQTELQRQQAEEEVQFLLTLSQAINNAPDFDKALEIALCQICEKTGWIYGEVWLKTADRSAIECSPSWYRRRQNIDAQLGEAIDLFREYSEALILLPGEELPGIVWEIGTPQWHYLSANSEDPFLRLETARQSGLSAAFSIPILTMENFGGERTQVLAVLSFFTLETREQDLRLSHLVSAVADQLGNNLHQKQIEAEQRGMFAAMTDLTLIYDRSGLCLKVAPTKTVNILDSSEELFGKTLHEVMDRETADRLLKAIHTTLDTGETQHIEYYLSPKNPPDNLQNQQIWLDASVSPLDEESAIIVARDISDRKATELALQTSEAKNRAILSAIPDLIFRMNAEGVCLDFVKAKEFASVMSSDIEPVGKNVRELIAPEMAERQIQAVRKVLASKEPLSYEQEVWIDRRLQYEEIRVVPSGENEVLFMVRDNSDRKRAELALRLAKQQSERLLLNILPRSIADRLKQSTGAIAEQYDSVSIIFADIVGFTPLSAQMSPIELVELLNQIFSEFDRLADKYDLEKIKTIGDAYMVVGGLPERKPDHLEAIADMALAMQAAMPQFHTTKLTQIQGEQTLQIRIGISTGSVVAGVIGMKKFIYDLWGDTVNVASRMEAQGEPRKIQMTADARAILGDRYHFSEERTISVKGKGEMTTYWLLGKNESGKS